ncbi:hypothetical protein PHSY_002339 [Pseudozyma hubeiensis SY62]|uniref:Uncharacterized protein n=1 Tax=Pseudozyma hubeiensis (strain SY62) TaxID=1305764 RepID=R9P0S4_PSEHS|nr:hypothetical protein PHSY_002339 [Pseudozyma hubeiensis SY62]GAC94766.1 hypothetical protein PHSY_002339 [Pseudozyma hubeiensis SY62]
MSVLRLLSLLRIVPGSVMRWERHSGKTKQATVQMAITKREPAEPFKSWRVDWVNYGRSDVYENKWKLREQRFRTCVKSLLSALSVEKAGCEARCCFSCAETRRFFVGYHDDEIFVMRKRRGMRSREQLQLPQRECFRQACAHDFTAPSFVNSTGPAEACHTV